MKQRSASFLNDIRHRRSVRDFSDQPVPAKIISDCILAAGSAPSGTNKQPWHFVVVCDAEVKHRIRQSAENVEHEMYNKRASEQWLNALAPLKTNSTKPFLETAPRLIAIFAEKYKLLPDGTKELNYYVTESVGIAIGILITAIHNAGLVCLPYTPSPMRFLNTILKRPENERPFLLLVIGYPADGITVPNLARKRLMR
ncbi:nitroreductase family protein [Chloroflexota bacterium]